jgi:hypothetical protein
MTDGVDAALLIVTFSPRNTRHSSRSIISSVENVVELGRFRSSWEGCEVPNIIIDRIGSRKGAKYS